MLPGLDEVVDQLHGLERDLSSHIPPEHLLYRLPADRGSIFYQSFSLLSVLHIELGTASNSGTELTAETEKLGTPTRLQNDGLDADNLGRSSLSSCEKQKEFHK